MITTTFERGSIRFRAFSLAISAAATLALLALPRAADASHVTWQPAAPAASSGTIILLGTAEPGDGENAPTSLSLELRYRFPRGFKRVSPSTFVSKGGVLTYHLRGLWRSGTDCVVERTIDHTGTRRIPTQSRGKVLIGGFGGGVRVPAIREFRVPSTTSYGPGCDVEPAIEEGSYPVEFPEFSFRPRVRGRRMTFGGRLRNAARGGLPLRYPLGTEADSGTLVGPHVRATLTLPSAPR